MDVTLAIVNTANTFTELLFILLVCVRQRWHQQLTKTRAEDETRRTSSAPRNPVSAKHGPRREKKEREVEDTGDGMKHAQKHNSSSKEHADGTRLERLNTNQTER